MKITRQQFLAIVPNCDKSADILHYINAWADTFEINTPLRMAHFWLVAATRLAVSSI